MELVRSEQKRLFGDVPLADLWAHELADDVGVVDERARTTLEFFARLGLSAPADADADEEVEDGDRWLADYTSALARDPQKIAIARPATSARLTAGEHEARAAVPFTATETGEREATARHVEGGALRNKPPSGSSMSSGGVSVRRASNPAIETSDSGARRPASPAFSSDGTVRVEQVTDRMGRPPLPPLALHQRTPADTEAADITAPVDALDRDSLPSTSRASSRKIQAIANDWYVSVCTCTVCSYSTVLCVGL